MPLSAVTGFKCSHKTIVTNCVTCGLAISKQFCTNIIEIRISTDMLVHASSATEHRTFFMKMRKTLNFIPAAQSETINIVHIVCLVAFDPDLFNKINFNINIVYTLSSCNLPPPQLPPTTTNRLSNILDNLQRGGMSVCSVGKVLQYLWYIVLCVMRCD